MVDKEGRVWIWLVSWEKEVRIWGLNPLLAWLPSGKEKVWQRQPLGGEPELAMGELFLERCRPISASEITLAFLR